MSRLSGLQFWECPVCVRCSVAECSAVMGGATIHGVRDGALTFVQDIAPGWTSCTAELANGKRHTVVLCPRHAGLVSLRDSLN